MSTVPTPDWVMEACHLNPLPHPLGMFCGFRGRKRETEFPVANGIGSFILKVQEAPQLECSLCFLMLKAMLDVERPVLFCLALSGGLRQDSGLEQRGPAWMLYLAL